MHNRCLQPLPTNDFCRSIFSQDSQNTNSIGTLLQSVQCYVTSYSPGPRIRRSFRWTASFFHQAGGPQSCTDSLVSITLCKNGWVCHNFHWMIFGYCKHPWIHLGEWYKRRRIIVIIIIITDTTSIITIITISIIITIILKIILMAAATPSIAGLNPLPAEPPVLRPLLA